MVEITKEIETASDVLKLSAVEAKQWINEVWSGKRKVADNFNWHGLAEVAGDYGRRGKESIYGASVYEWTEIAVSVYEKLAEEYRPEHRHSFVLDAMFQRAWAIIRSGEKRGDYVLDPEIIVRWFFDNLNYSLEEATNKAKEFRSLKGIEEMQAFGREKILDLRYLKQRLTPIKDLVENANYKPSEELAKWLEIRTLLP